MTCPPTRARLCFDRAHGVTMDPSCPTGSPGGRRSLVLSTTAGAVRVRGTDPMVAPPTMTALRGGYVLVAPASSPPWTVTPGAPVTLTLRHCNPPTDMSMPASIFGLLTDDLCGAYELLIDARAGCAGAGGF